MARVFNGIDQYLSTPTVPVSSYPCTFNCWFFTSNLTDQSVLMSAGTSLTTNYLFTSALGSDPSNPVRAGHRWTVFSTIDTAVGYLANTWHMVTAVWTDQSNLSIYLDGNDVQPVVQNAGAPNFGGLNDFSVGSRLGPTRTLFADASIGECAVWDIALDATEVGSLIVGGAAVLANQVRGTDLTFYARYVDDDLSVVGPQLTPFNNPTFGEHPPMASAGAVQRSRGAVVMRFNPTGGLANVRREELG